jgi:hypothetical protein
MLPCLFSRGAFGWHPKILSIMFNGVIVSEYSYRILVPEYFVFLFVSPLNIFCGFLVRVWYSPLLVVMLVWVRQPLETQFFGIQDPRMGSFKKRCTE